MLFSCFVFFLFPFSKVSIHIIHSSRVVDSVVLCCRGPVECSHSIEVPMCPSAGGCASSPLNGDSAAAQTLRLSSGHLAVPHRTAAAGTAARATRRQGGRERALVENRTASDVGSQLRLL